MRASLFVAVFVAFAVVALASPVVGAPKKYKTQNTQWHELDNYTYDNFLQEYKKTQLLQSGAEYAKRKAIFEANIAAIKAHNANPNRSYTMNVNKFGDMTEEEFLSTFTGYAQGKSPVTQARKLHNKFAPEFPNAMVHANANALPTSVDWREKGVSSPVKNQASCGSCWAFAAASTFESHAAIATGRLENLSTQQLTACTPNPRHCGGSGGCNGATAQLAFEHIANNGITDNQHYPYTAGGGVTGECKFNPTTTPPVFKSDGFVQIASNNLTAHLHAVATYGPISVSVAASKWMFYSSGIFNDCADLKNVDVNHAVVLDGYGVAGNQKYWLIKNSWGANWGEKGYIRLLRRDVEVCGNDPTPDHGSACDGGPTQVTVCGECGVLYDSAFPFGVQLA